TDISDFVKAERDVAEARSLLKILRTRDRFQGFVESLNETLTSLKATLAGDVDERQVKQVLHTVKGNLGVYGLGDLAQSIHELEGQTKVSAGDVAAFEESVRGFLEKHHSLLGTSYDARREVVYTLPECLLADAERRLARFTDQANLKAFAAGLLAKF